MAGVLGVQREAHRALRPVEFDLDIESQRLLSFYLAFLSGLHILTPFSSYCPYLFP